jgi:hypothetical protein
MVFAMPAPAFFFAFFHAERRLSLPVIFLACLPAELLVVAASGDRMIGFWRSMV